MLLSYHTFYGMDTLEIYKHQRPILCCELCGRFIDRKSTMHHLTNDHCVIGFEIDAHNRLIPVPNKSMVSEDCIFAQTYIDSIFSDFDWISPELYILLQQAPEHEISKTSVNKARVAYLMQYQYNRRCRNAFPQSS